MRTRLNADEVKKIPARVRVNAGREERAHCRQELMNDVLPCPLMDDEFDIWNGVKKQTHHAGRVPVKLGEVRWCKLGVNVGVEQNGSGSQYTRPILVLKKFSDEIVLGAPLTTRGKKGDWYYPLPHFGEGSCVILNQARPIDTKRLLKGMGEVSENELRKIVTVYCALISPYTV